MSASLKRYSAGSSPESKKRCLAPNRVPMEPQPLCFASKKDERRTGNGSSSRPQPFQKQAAGQTEADRRKGEPLEKAFISKTMEQTTAAINAFFSIPSHAPQPVSKTLPAVCTSKQSAYPMAPLPSAPPQPAPAQPYLIPKAASAPVHPSKPIPAPSNTCKPVPVPISSNKPMPFVPPSSSSVPRPFIPNPSIQQKPVSKHVMPKDDCPEINIDEWLDTFSDVHDDRDDQALQLYLESTLPADTMPKAHTPPTAPKATLAPPTVVTKPVPYAPPSIRSYTPVPANKPQPVPMFASVPSPPVKPPVPSTHAPPARAPAPPAPANKPLVPSNSRAPSSAPVPVSAPPPKPPVPSSGPVPFVPPPTSTNLPVPFVPRAPSPPQSKDPLLDFPPRVRQAYQSRGIKNMYDWQKEVLGLPSVKAGGNLVFSLPTSGGKSLVAEVLLLRSVLGNKSGILVMPYVALVDEKVDALEPFTKLLGFEVVTSAGSTSQVPMAGTKFISICTNEKANALLNTLITEKRQDEIGCIVVDELHMVGEDGRGHTLELFLTKALTVIPKCQIVGMSATVPNLPSLAKWLEAELYESDFRPVSLKQYLIARQNKSASQLYDPEGQLIKTLDTKSDDETVAHLVNEVIPGCCCLVFCTTKSECERTCRWLAKHVSAAAQQHRTSQRQMLLKELKSVVSGSIDGDLEGSILAGVSYHHAGLTSEERKLIEAAFRDKVINIICCTSTLAAGVNLPARRVIIRYPYTGPAFLTKSRYLQMCGRAGRAGLDVFGESFLITRDRDLNKSRALMQMPIEELNSKSGTPEAIERTILDIVATETATTKAAIKAFMSKMLKNIEAGNEEHWKRCEEKINELLKCRIVTPRVSSSQEGDRDESVLECSSFGMSAYKSGFSSKEAQRLKKELKEMQETGLILAHDLHMLYYLTPIRDIWGWRVNWGTYAAVFGKAPPLCRKIASMIGLSESYILMKSALQSETVNTDSHDEYICRRFLLALMLSELLSEVPITKVAEKYSAERGQLQNLQANSSLFCTMMVNFTESMGWTSLQVTIQSYVKRLDCGVKADCAHLTEIRGVQAGRARCLWNAGYRDIQKIAQADPETMVSRVKQAGTKGGRENMAAKFFSPSAAATIIQGAKKLFHEQVAQKRKELQLLEQSSLVPS